MKRKAVALSLAVLMAFGMFSACGKEKYWYVSVNDLEGYQIVADIDKTADGQKIKVRKNKKLQFSLIIDVGYNDEMPSVLFNEEEISGTKDLSYTAGTKWDFNEKLGGDGTLVIFGADILRYTVGFSNDRALSPMGSDGIFTESLYNKFNIRSNYMSFSSRIDSFLQFLEVMPLDNRMHGDEFRVIISKASDDYGVNGVELHYKFDDNKDYEAVSSAGIIEGNTITFTIIITGNITIYPVVCAAELAIDN